MTSFRLIPFNNAIDRNCLPYGKSLFLNIENFVIIVIKMVNYVSHVEIPVLDVKQAKKWYESIFDWKVDNESYGPGYGFVYFKDHQTSLGLTKVDKIPGKGINVVFEVDDIDAKLQEIEKAGGKTVSPKSLITEEVGYSAQFQDCFGNELGLHSPK